MYKAGNVASEIANLQASLGASEPRSGADSPWEIDAKARDTQWGKRMGASRRDADAVGDCFQPRIKRVARIRGYYAFLIFFS